MHGTLVCMPFLHLMHTQVYKYEYQGTERERARENTVLLFTFSCIVLVLL